MPAYRLSFAIFVGCEEDFRGVFDSSLELVYPFFLITGDNIERAEAVIDVYTKSRPLLLFNIGRDLGGVVGEVSDMPV
jgi:hypothetical protein